MPEDQRVFFGDLRVEASSISFTVAIGTLLIWPIARHETFDVVVLHLLEDLSGHLVAQDVEQQRRPLQATHRLKCIRTVLFLHPLFDRAVADFSAVALFRHPPAGFTAASTQPILQNQRRFMRIRVDQGNDLLADHFAFDLHRVHLFRKNRHRLLEARQRGILLQALELLDRLRQEVSTLSTVFSVIHLMNGRTTKKKKDR